MLFFKKKLHFSLSNEYFLFTAIVLSLVCFISASFFIYSYYLYSKQKTASIVNLATLISYEINDIFEENENILKFFGHKIADKIDSNDLHNIANLLISTVDLNIKKMTKSYISWVNTEGKLTVSGKHGILKDKFPDIKNRKYFVTAKNNPWKMQISDPDKSIFSNDNILPTGIGIQNKSGKFIGYLVLGLRIDHINRYLAKIIDAQKISYILFNNDYKRITSSEIFQDNLYDSIDFKKLSNLTSKNVDVVVIPEKFKVNNFEYTHLIKVANYPFYILAGFDTNYYKQEFLYKVSSRLVELLLIGIFCLILLYFFRKKIILPITNLADLAFEISKGKLNTTIPKQNSIEMYKLAKGLSQVVRSMKKTEDYKQKLELANKIAKDSDLARSEFIKKMQYEFGSYLREIYFYAHFICKYLESNSITEEQIVKSTNKIQEIVMLIYNKTSTTLERNHFNLTCILDQAIKVNMKLSFFKGINIITNFNKKLPKIYADEFRIKQIIISLLYKSIENSPKNSNIFLNVDYHLKEGTTWFEITIKDQSFGLEENELNILEERFYGDDPTIFELTKMKMKHIEKLVKMHKGKIQIINKLNEGRTVKLHIPLLLKKETYPLKNILYM